jgi:predicted dehydrogenase
MGNAHASAMAALEEVRVVAVADVGAARAFTDAHALTRWGGVEAVLIATPHPLHAPIALYATKRGVHVLSEKPLAISAAAADRVIATCRAQGVLLGVMFQQRTDPSWRTIKRLVEGGALGAVYRLSLVTTAYRPQAYYASAAWLGSWDGEGGGVLMNQAPHALAGAWRGPPSGKGAPMTRPRIAHSQGPSSRRVSYTYNFAGVLDRNFPATFAARLLNFRGSARGR